LSLADRYKTLNYRMAEYINADLAKKAKIVTTFLGVELNEKEKEQASSNRRMETRKGKTSTWW